MNFNNHDLTLPGLETLTQGIILELNFLICSCDNNTMNPLELIQNLSLIHPELIECTLQNQPMDIPTFANDYTLSYYLNAVKPINSSTSEWSENMTKEDIKYLSRKNRKDKNKRFDGENHIVAVSESKKEKIKDVPKGENLSEVPEGEILGILPSHFQEQFSILIEPTQPVNIGNQDTPQIIHIAQSLSVEELKDFTQLFLEKKINFAWMYSDMPGLDPDLIMHHLSITPGVKLVKQKHRKMHLHVALLVKAELEKLLKARFIRAIDYVE